LFHVALLRPAEPHKTPRPPRLRDGRHAVLKALRLIDLWARRQQCSAEAQRVRRVVLGEPAAVRNGAACAAARRSRASGRQSPVLRPRRPGRAATSRPAWRFGGGSAAPRSATPRRRRRCRHVFDVKVPASSRAPRATANASLGSARRRRGVLGHHAEPDIELKYRACARSRAPRCVRRAARGTCRPRRAGTARRRAQTLLRRPRWAGGCGRRLFNRPKSTSR
jgi:hypothetical protein